MANYTLESIWRYPVKSMGGEKMGEVSVGVEGLEGDRAFALVDRGTGKVGSAKSVRRFGELLRYGARLEGDSLLVTGPDGRELGVDDWGAFGEDVALVARGPEAEGLLLEFPAGTLAGKHAETTEGALAGAAPAGSLFDAVCLHILTSATLRSLRDAYLPGDFDVARFRPNLVVDCGEEEGFVENKWVGKTVAIGDEMVARVMMPCPRCVMTTLPRRELPLDPGILKTAAQLNRLDLGEYGHLPCVGVYAEVVKPGRVVCGDAVRVEE